MPPATGPAVQGDAEEATPDAGPALVNGAVVTEHAVRDGDHVTDGSAAAPAVARPEPATGDGTEEDVATPTRETPAQAPATAGEPDGTDRGETEPAEPVFSRRVRMVPYLLAALFFVPYEMLAFFRMRRMEPLSLDLALFEQAVKAYAHFEVPISNLKGAGFNLLGDHFHPLLAVLAPVYRIFPHYQTLLAAQSFLLALSIVPVTRMAMRRLGVPTGILIGAAYGLSYGLQTAANFDFHEIALGVPIMAFSLEALIRRRYVTCVVWAALLFGVKEDLGLTVAALGVVLTIRRQWKLGPAVAAASLALFYLVMFVIVPSLNPEDKYAYSEQTKVSHSFPFGVMWELVDDNAKVKTIWFLLLVTAFVALRSPIFLLVLPTLAWRLTSSNANHWGNGFHYDAILMPVVFMAAIDGLPKLLRSAWRPVRVYALHAPVVILVIGAMLIDHPYPFEELINPRTYSLAERNAGAQAALAAIPDGVKVEADQALAHWLVHRDDVYWVGGSGGVKPDYIVIDASGGQSPPDLVAWANTLEPPATYTLVLHQQGYAVLKRAS